MINKA